MDIERNPYLLSSYAYDLPRDLIAQRPAEARDRCRLLIVDRKRSTVDEGVFADIATLLAPGDCLVINDTKVVPARLYGKRASGGRVEIFLIDTEGDTVEALVRPSARIREGETVELGGGDVATVLGRGSVGRVVRFSRPALAIASERGHTPLPPYIDRDDDASDAETYQTVYASREGGTASPTAGLHFSRELLGRIERSGVDVVSVTLHTNYGTFAPVTVEDIRKHRMHRERYAMDSDALGKIRAAYREGRRIVAVGTTSTRVLEHCAEAVASRDTVSGALEGVTDLFCYPGYRFKVVGALITNFHLPQSTLLMLTAAFAGGGLIRAAYEKAVSSRFRFYSYGDAMIVV